MKVENQREIPVSRNTRIVDVRTIQYIEKRRNQCVLHCIDAEITCYETLRKIQDKLDKNIFIYVHQGYIVNFDAIKEVKENVVCLGDGVGLSVTYVRTRKLCYAILFHVLFNTLMSL